MSQGRLVQCPVRSKFNMVDYNQYVIVSFQMVRNGNIFSTDVTQDILKQTLVFDLFSTVCQLYWTFSTWLDKYNIHALSVKIQYACIVSKNTIYLHWLWNRSERSISIPCQFMRKKYRYIYKGLLKLTFTPVSKAPTNKYYIFWWCTLKYCI
jgi:hypothetical protein